MTRYIELRCRSAFSFLSGASDPEDLVDAAADAGVQAVALSDLNGLYGAPRFYRAAREVGIRPLVGAQLSLSGGSRLLVLVKSRPGYKNLCRLITRGHADNPKGQSQISLEAIEPYAEGLLCLTGGALDRALKNGTGKQLLEKLRQIFGSKNVFVEISRHLKRRQADLNHALTGLAAHAGLPVVATNDVRYAYPRGKRVLDVFTCLRHKTRLDEAGRNLASNREQYLKSPAQITALFRDFPKAVENTLRVAERCEFTLDNLGYQFPDYPAPAGETSFGYLRRLVQRGARSRYRPIEPRHSAQLNKELAIIAKLNLSGYFLAVWDICRYCKERGIVVQGRGSAANSAVCYALGITAVDPVGMELLFERFLSEQRGQWPDIDLDLPSGEKRESVIQYVYRRWGGGRNRSEPRVAMTANLITYRQRSAVREVGKVLGLEERRLAKMLEVSQATGKELDEAAAVAGLDARDKRVQLLVELCEDIQHLPRHLGQHCGGMVMCKGRLDEVAPLEPAAMPGRTVIQWDKDDCSDLGIIKVDLLGLGMLKAIEDALPLIKTHEGVEVDLAHLPQNDPQVYALLQRADTVGVFQVESRAQMNTLPRMKPKNFYDLVVEVAIIRPGPIVGKKVHPYLRRRAGKEPVTFPHPLLEPILRRTLGIPLFQEQAMRIAMEVGGFDVGEAEEMCRAMKHKRSKEHKLKQFVKLKEGLQKRGLQPPIVEQIVSSLGSFFGPYGFPESHAASFALIVYASAYLKAHHPAAFYCSLLNAWPMGFYHPATLIKDAKRRGQTIRPIDVNHSGWSCKIESDGAVRLGLRFVRGLRRPAGMQIESEQAEGAFKNLLDFHRRCDLRENERNTLAALGAFGKMGLDRRAALWQVAALESSGKGLLERIRPPEERCPLPRMTAAQRTQADYQNCGMTTGPHPLAHLRDRLRTQGVLPLASLERLPNGRWVTIAGVIITRQRPGTAKGMCFITLEDESGLANLVITPNIFKQNRLLLVSSPGLVVIGPLERHEGVIHVKGRHFNPLNLSMEPSIPQSRDFR